MDPGRAASLEGTDGAKGRWCPRRFGISPMKNSASAMIHYPGSLVFVAFGGSVLSDVLYDKVRAVELRDGAVHLLDQRVLPGTIRYEVCTTARAVAEAITAMVVRGAPAIGVTAAYGAVLAVKAAYEKAPNRWRREAAADLALLRLSRPTAVNLAWALDVMERVMAEGGGKRTRLSGSRPPPAACMPTISPPTGAWGPTARPYCPPRRGS